jgi:hypothetical protein
VPQQAIPDLCSIQDYVPQQAIPDSCSIPDYVPQRIEHKSGMDCCGT